MRVETKTVRKAFATTLASKGVTGREFSKCTNAIYVALFGKSCRELLAAKQLMASCNLRDNLTADELAKVSFAESRATRKLSRARISDSSECETICSSVATRVASIR